MKDLVFQDFQAKHEILKVGVIGNQVINNPLVSICVQTYQHEQYISQCLDSILTQEVDFEFEILLGEDDSTDGTREICLKYAEKYLQKIRLFLHHRENNIVVDGKPTGRFNFLYNLYSARGKYIAMCEGDDYWTDPGKLQKQVDFLENNPDYVLCHHDAKMINEHGEQIKENQLSRKKRRDYSKYELQKGSHMLTLSVCFRNVLETFPHEFLQTTWGDLFLFGLLGKYGKAKFMSNIRPAIYRVHNQGAWSMRNQISKWEAGILSYGIIGDYFDRNGENRLATYYYGRKYDCFISKCFYFIKTGSYLKAREMINSNNSIPKVIENRLTRIIDFFQFGGITNFFSTIQTKLFLKALYYKYIKKFSG